MMTENKNSLKPYDYYNIQQIVSVLDTVDYYHHAQWIRPNREKYETATRLFNFLVAKIRPPASL